MKTLQIFLRLFTSLLIFPCMFAFSAEENFLLIDGNTGEIVVEFGPHNDEQVTPACSFNIALSLMGYDAGILKDEYIPKWDFQEGYDDFSESWKASQTPQTWMTRSCVWYSKILSLQLGLETIQRYLKLLEYGNQDMSGGLAKPGPKNAAWISSSLAISPREQVYFIQKMIHEKLSVSKIAIQMTKILIFKDDLPRGWKLYGKTGLGSIFTQDGSILKVRWFVGWIEKNHTFFPFAYQMREKISDVSQTVPRVKELLIESNVMTGMIYP
jgi:beta-lactamase class D